MKRCIVLFLDCVVETHRDAAFVVLEAVVGVGVKEQQGRCGLREVVEAVGIGLYAEVVDGDNLVFGVARGQPGDALEDESVVGDAQWLALDDFAATQLQLKAFRRAQMDGLDVGPGAAGAEYERAGLAGLEQAFSR